MLLIGFTFIFTGKKIYAFQHGSGEIFTGTRNDLIEKTGVTRGNLSRLFSRKGKTASGWCVAKEQEDVPPNN